jgi:O-acetyl-ADP-ribose deacetylase (regulator of RNase III)
VITPAFRLKARHVIHTVAPVYSQHAEADVWRLLASCYRNSLALASRHDARSIAFPGLGTGIYGIPVDGACGVAVDAALEHAASADLPEQIVFCCFSEDDADLYRRALAAKGS